jgi:hypothetical protein
MKSFVETFTSKNVVAHLYQPRYGGFRLVTSVGSKNFNTKLEALKYLEELGIK